VTQQLRIEQLITALELPAASRVDQRIPKKLLLENGAATATDKRRINEGIEELHWVAALKPTTVGIPAYRDETREYLEIAVLRLTLRGAAKGTRLVELIHRAVPYPAVLLTEHGDRPELSAAHKRWSQGEADKTVLDGEVIMAESYPESNGKCWLAFRDALALGHQPHTTLYALYQGWIDTILALRAARVTGVFVVTDGGAHSAARQDALREYTRLDGEISRLRAAAAKERQLPKQVELNLELKRAAAAQAAARAKL
jgi:hypothetical protein